MLKRKSEGYLEAWIQKSRRKPLTLRGARQVGKSTLVRMFAQKNGLRLNEINLERHLYLDDIFKTLDTGNIIRELEGIVAADIRRPDSILFLDEIQATPHALQALRYFYEDTPEIPVIAAGSLLEFTLAHHVFPMPVGRVEYYHLGPMTFKEFLREIQPALLKYIEDFDFSDQIPETARKKLLEKQREYFFTGGMPEAVAVFKENRSFARVSEVHRSIVETYLDDFSKYAKPASLPLMQKVFRHIPLILGKKVKYSNIAREKKSRDVKNIIDLLVNARVCHKVCHSHSNGVPLRAEISEDVYKLIFMDIGIVNHICGNDWTEIKSFLGSQLTNEGGLAEQFIGQQLISLKNQIPLLCYWLREKKSANAEVDYVISVGNNIFPIEVKSGKSGKLKSLHQFVLKKKRKIAIRFDLNPPSVEDASCVAPTGTGDKYIKYKLISLPLYMAEEAPRLLRKRRF
ncbi:conserved hypothetical protein [Candidatus Desulfarcum epimagneticum]|uniref:AAA+ ATPase domain-containing protein n=1 Tax=uncultured Desulfobacteraceae bacterium TaxID=218296 RepID=A0A484HK80_9BACT|nr:conserved hypothetical protein [uncultured Desulfobacteraceae bacterium]